MARPTELTYTVTSGALAFNDGFQRALTRDPGEAAGVYPSCRARWPRQQLHADLRRANLKILAAPVAQDQSVATNEDTALGIILVAADADNDSLTYSIVTCARSWHSLRHRSQRHLHPEQATPAPILSPSRQMTAYR